MGTSQAQIAKVIGTNPTQLSVFLKGNGTLPSSTLDKLLNLIGINLELYNYRSDMANRVVESLKRKDITQTQLDKLNKNDIIQLTGIQEIDLLVDVYDTDKYLEILNSRLIDIESTFPYFKALVSYKFNLKDNKVTSSMASTALKLLLPTVHAASALFKYQQKGSLYLFDKYNKESLSTKAIKYIEMEQSYAKDMYNKYNDNATEKYNNGYIFEAIYEELKNIYHIIDYKEYFSIYDFISIIGVKYWYIAKDILDLEHDKYVNSENESDKNNLFIIRDNIVKTINDIKSHKNSVDIENKLMPEYTVILKKIESILYNSQFEENTSEWNIICQLAK